MSPVVPLGMPGAARPVLPVARWVEVVAEAPELAEAVWARFTAHKHHVLATLTGIGSPRVSGTEVGRWRGDLWFGSMWGARKATDLQRDPRFALHANPGDGTMLGGDAKVSGRVREVVGAELDGFLAENEVPQPLHLFVAELHTVTLTELTEAGDGIRITTWRARSGVTTTVRS